MLYGEELKQLPFRNTRQRNRILSAIDGLTQTPPVGDIKPMQGKPEGCFRLRVGGYRVIYRYDKDGAAVVLLILDVGTRRDVYK